MCGVQRMQSDINVHEYLGKWTLIAGDVNTGKTTLSASIMNAMCAQGFGPRIAIIDLAPEIPEALAAGRNLKGAGGKLLPPSMYEVIYLSDRLKAPRLSSRSEEEAVEKAGRNAVNIEKLFRGYNGFERDILFINDISLYLQAETAKKFIKQLAKAATLVANGYYGEKLGSGIISERERWEMEALIKYVEAKGQVIWKK